MVGKLISTEFSEVLNTVLNTYITTITM